MPWLTLLLSPLGRYLLMAAGICLAFAAGYLKGHIAADRAAEVAQLEADVKRARVEQAEAVRQALAASRIARDAAQRQREAEAQAIDLQSELDAYVNELEQAKGSLSCGLSERDVDRLRNLARGRTASPPHPSSRPAELR